MVPATVAVLPAERYRSGRNGGASKASCPQGHVGSNPTLSAIINSFRVNNLRGRIFRCTCFVPEATPRGWVFHPCTAGCSWGAVPRQLGRRRKFAWCRRGLYRWPIHATRQRAPESKSGEEWRRTYRPQRFLGRTNIVSNSGRFPAMGATRRLAVRQSQMRPTRSFGNDRRVGAGGMPGVFLCSIA